jgi:hypothetical protein
MKVNRYFLILILLLILLVGFLKLKNLRGDSFSQVVQVNDLNTKIHVSAPESVNDFKFSSGVTLVVDNLTDDLIKLYPPGEGIKIYIKSNNDWIEIRNLINYYPLSAEIPVPPKNTDSPGGSMFDVKPDILNANEKTTVRIVLIGQIYKNNLPTNQKVGAYTDVILFP